MKVFVFGSDYAGDNIGYRVAEELKHELDFDFIHSNDPSDLLYEDKVVIMDAVQGLKEVRVFHDISDLKAMNISSLHDFDLGFFLRLSERMGMRKKVTIVGLPMEGDLDRIREDASESLQELKGSYVRSLARRML